MIVTPADGATGSVSLDKATWVALQAAVEHVGDRWSLLLVHALLEGPQRFSDLHEKCGIAPNILSRRLDRLQQATVVSATPYCRKPLRHHYELTPRGRELGSVLRLLAAWGDRHGAAPSPRHAACGAVAEVRWYCPTCDKLLDRG